MERWQKILQKSTTDLKVVAKKFDIPEEDIDPLIQTFDMRITPYYMSLIKEKGEDI